MRAAGLRPEDYEGDDVEVWPENWPAVEVFVRMNTQWAVGMSGPTGLNYLVLFDLLDRAGHVGPEWDRMFDDVRVLEREALSVMRENND
ncbi:DUF1799 domain-containing protein [Aromatoleum toluolicum]|uniref:Uncharacterized protein n=1 Tax=Aromatoleum toluolicum TaxID=90060 RepID=A0ABX1NGH1_9RHOO|nr:DUF1799 domain-containing protein [Aromatoleum toluolicum]NMF98385.1 DUF1799 domain-containing protein [Aromatoleum toluolicum]